MGQDPLTLRLGVCRHIVQIQVRAVPPIAKGLVFPLGIREEFRTRSGDNVPAVLGSAGPKRHPIGKITFQRGGDHG